MSETTEERMRVLEMVREGKITADEGVRLLEALRAAAGSEPGAGQPRNQRAARAGRAADPVSSLMESIGETISAVFSREGQDWRRELRERFGGAWGATVGGSLRGLERRRQRESEGWEYIPLSDGRHGTFALPEGTSLRIESEAGGIEARAADGPARVDLQGDEPRNFDVYVARKGPEVVVAAHRTAPDARMPRLIVSVPPSVTDVSVRTAGGSVKARDFACRLELKTAGGGINVENQRASDVHAQTAGGSIDVDGTPERVTLHTAGGSIRFHGRTSALDAKTAGGSITIDGVRLTSGQHHARTAGGSVRVRLTRDSSVTINASTNAGSIHVDLPGAEGTYTGSRIAPRYHGRYNAGDATLELRTVGGSVSVGLIEEAQAAAAA